MKWFTNCACVEDLKQLYHELVKKFHPDVSGADTTETMQEINNEFDNAFPRLKNIHRNFKGETYESKKPTVETPEEFRHIIDALIHMENIKVEIIGRWIWVTGNTKPYKEELKKLKFTWASKKMAWSWHKPEDASLTRGKYDLNEIRSFFGSSVVDMEKEKRPQLSGA